MDSQAEDRNIVVLKRKPVPTLEDLDVQLGVALHLIDRQTEQIDNLHDRVRSLERRLSGPHG